MDLDRAHKDPLARGMHASYGCLIKGWFSKWLGHFKAQDPIITSIRQSSEKNTIVYVLPSASVLEYILVNLICLKYRLPLARFATDIPFYVFQTPFTALLRLFQRLFTWPKNQAAILNEERQMVHESVLEGDPVCVFLKKPGFFGKPEKWHVVLWEQFIVSHKKTNRNIHFVPIVFIWSRSPGRLRRSTLATFFQDPNSLGIMRKLLLIWRFPDMLNVTIGAPVDMGRFLEEVAKNKLDVQAKKLRRLLASYLYRERKILTGPPIRPREKVIQKVMADPRLVKTVADHSARKKIPEHLVWKRVRRILDEMTANYQPLYIDIAYRFVTWIQQRLYQNVSVDPENLRTIKELAKAHSILYLPCHRSYMDPLLLSKVLYESGLTPPHIAAGINLAFFPVGSLFRKTGAFFIRRKISGDLIYARTLAGYIRWLIKAGYPQEFFIEGTRTRTGQLRPPKVGLLSSELEACLEQEHKDLFLIPTALTYDRVPDESEYRKEHQGVKKTKESWKGLLKAKKFLSRKHGGVYLRFSKPISVFDFFSREKAQGVFPTKERVHELANTVIARIADSTVLTTSSLISTCILSRREPEIQKASLIQDIAQLKHAAVMMGLPVVPELNEIEPRIDEYLGFFLQARWIESSNGLETFSIHPKHRLVLEFHKNICLHHFLPFSMHGIEGAFKERELPEAFKERLHAVFIHEFPYAKLSPARPPEGSGGLFLGMIRSFVETYLFIARAVLENGFQDPHELHKSILREEKNPRELPSYLMVKNAYEFFLQNKSVAQLSAFESALSETLNSMT